MIALLCATNNSGMNCYNSLVSQGVVGYPQLVCEYCIKTIFIKMLDPK